MKTFVGSQTCSSETTKRLPPFNLTTVLKNEEGLQFTSWFDGRRPCVRDPVKKDLMIIRAQD